MAKVIQGVIPPTGFHYMQSDVRLEGYSLEDLIKTVSNFRAENNLPAGDPSGDVADYICSNWPHFCHSVDRVTINVGSSVQQNELLNDIQVWARNLLTSDRERILVGDELAEARAKICRACPSNVNWRGGCSSCISATERISANLRQARDTTSTPVLGGCKTLRHDNRTAVFLQPDELSVSADLPADCWLNK